MCDCKKIGIFAAVMALLAFIVHNVEAVATMGYYTDPAYLDVWSKIMMPAAGPPPPEFAYLSIAFAFITWAIFGMVYEKLGGAIKQKDAVKKGLVFGSLVFLLAGLPGSLSMFLLLNLPVGLIISWTISGALLYLIGGVVAARLIKA